MDESNDELLQEFQRKSHEVGLKVTTARFAVYRYLKTGADHPVVDRVWDAVKQDLPAITRESVYRILNDFASHGIVAVVDRSDVVARYDCNPVRHDHFVCERCGRFFDFELSELPGLVEPIVTSFGTIGRVEIRASGVCKSCLAQENAPNPNVESTR